MLQLVMLALALVMFIAPKSCTRKADREEPEKVAKTKRGGMILLGVTAAWILISVLRYLV